MNTMKNKQRSTSKEAKEVREKGALDMKRVALVTHEGWPKSYHV